MNNPLSPFNLASPQLETGRVVVEASAGTGKTYSLTVLVVRHVAERSLTADQLLMVTFTNAATAELREKTREQAQETLQHLHNKNLEHPWMATMLATPEARATAIANLQQFLSHFDDTTITTIHGFCQIVLRRAGLHSPAPQNYVVQDNVDDIISQVITDLLNDPMSTNTRLLHGKLYPRSGDTPHPLTSSDVRSSLSKLREAVKRRMGNPKALMLPELAPSPFATKTDALKKRDSEITQQAETIASYVSTVIAEVHRRSYAAGIITYDDMVRMVAETLEKNDEVAQNLARSIASQYSIVMVDEFQDTDASQWSIFSHIYEANPQEVTLVTVGDPKQAIYRFRGADVQVYIDAVRNVKQAHALDTNYRSDKKLLIALETLLQNNTFDTAGQVPFVRVNAAKKNEDGAVTSISVPPIPNVPGASLEIRYLANDPKLYAGTRINKDKSLTALNNDGSLVQRIFWRDMANHVVELLQHGSIPDKKSAIDGTTRAVTPNDIAILVNSHSDAETAVRYLHESLVPAVRFKTDSVFGSQAAMHWLMLLGALANPGKPQFVRAYALSWFGNVNEDELAQASDDTVATWQRECAENAELLRSRGVATLFLSFRNRAGFLQRVLGEDDGERNITDLDHLAEILASVPHFARNAGAGECYETLSELVNDSDSRNEQFQRRIEGDEVAVKVMTIHSSKGLQFPIVFLPTLIKKPPSIGSNPQMFSFTFPGESSSRRILDIASGHKGASNWVFSPTGDDDVFFETIYKNKREKKKVDLGRNLLAKNDVFFDSKRLLYVALTRAEHKVVLYWSATGENNGKGNIKVALAQTLSTHDAQLAGIPVEVEPLNALMAKIAGASQGTIAAIPLTATKAKPLEWTQSSSTPHTPASTAQYARTSAVRTYGFARWSYSTLSKTLTGDHYNKDSDNDIGGVTDESNDVPTLPPLVSSINIALDTAIATMPLYDIAGSNTFGNTVHEIFDSINPASLHLNEDVHDEVEHHFVNTHSTEQRAKIVEGIIASVHAPLGDPFAGHTLHSLGTTHRLSELEFNFHLPHNDVEAFPLSKIGALMLEHGDLDPYLTAYAQDIADNPSTVTVAGYMTGSIDAVFRVKSETSNPIYVVADYKTNRLHKPAKEHENPLTPYHPDNLVASMVKEGYILQALVYSVALHRYLQWRQPGYDPNIHLGGAAYLYVRGMTGHSTDEPTPRPYGVYHWRPTTDLVLALDALFTGKGN